MSRRVSSHQPRFRAHQVLFLLGEHPPDSQPAMQRGTPQRHSPATLGRSLLRFSALSPRPYTPLKSLLRASLSRLLSGMRLKSDWPPALDSEMSQMPSSTLFRMRCARVWKTSCTFSPVSALVSRKRISSQHLQKSLKASCKPALYNAPVLERTCSLPERTPHSKCFKVLQNAFKML